MIKVVKFGGSSLSCGENFLKVKDIVQADPARCIVVVSAPGKRRSDDNKVTDLLYTCHAHIRYKVPYDDIWENIASRYREIASTCGLRQDIHAELSAVRESMTRQSTVDYIVSRGEFLNAKLMAECLGYEFVDATRWLFFDFNGRVDYEKSYATLAQILESSPRVVLPGFYGALPDGNVHVFSRGGSDVTGALAAAAVNAESYENWTDVSGFLIADPRIIDNPEKIETITYRELRELSYMGASVLHEEAIFPVRREGIPINIRNTNEPDDKGTWIVESTCQKSRFVITGIAGKRGFCSINIEKDMMNSEIGFGRKVLQAFEDNGIAFEHVPSGIDTMTIFVHQDEFMHKEQNVVAAIHRLADPDMIDIEADLALIAVVGRGMKSTRGTAGRIFSALAHANINVRMIDQGSSELNIIIGVKNEDFEEAIKAIYDIFVLVQL